MFSLVELFEGGTKVYNKGDVIHFSFKGEIKMKGVFDKVTDFGQVCLGNISLVKGKKVIATDSYMKLGTYEMFSYNKKAKSCFVLLDGSAVKSKLVSYRGKVEFNEGDNVSVEVLKDTGSVIYTGEYCGLLGDKINLKNCTVNEKLLLLNKKPLKTIQDCVIVEVNDINSMWYKGNSSNRYKVRVDSTAVV